MGEFFKGWRRKAGLVTLAMACVLTVAWMRSYVVGDIISFGIDDQQHQLLSCNGRFAWQSFPELRESDREDKLSGLPKLRSFKKSDRFFFDEVSFAMRDGRSLPGWVTPYWSLILPLTLLSAWLILGKRSKPRATDSGPPQN